MKFCIISNVSHIEKEGKYYAYGPYVREMNLWLHDTEIIIVAPKSNRKTDISAIMLPYNYKHIKFIEIPDFNLLTYKSVLYTFLKIPILMFQLVRGMLLADHIHLRCPGNVGLIGCFLQILFPNKRKTVKYAGNWDWNSKQPWSYRLQQRILRNTFLSRNMKVLVYGSWPNQTKNIIPFFTASYNEIDRIAISPREFQGHLKLLFVGSLANGKQPLISCIAAKQLLDKGITVSLDLYGDGPERKQIETYISGNQLQKNIHLHGNQKGEQVKAAYQEAHFLVFLSESEGWPKAVAEAMWWGCLPVTTSVSCVPEMLGYGERGDLVHPNPEEIINRIEYYINCRHEYKSKCTAAMEWSRQFTLERFENEVKLLMYS